MLINREKYVELFEQGLLKKNVICRDLIEIKLSRPSSLKNFEIKTPNPDEDELLNKVFVQENGQENIEEEKIQLNIIGIGKEKKKKKKEGHLDKNNSIWNEIMEVEEEKNNIQTLCENKFKMKSFLDEKFDSYIKINSHH